jgi:kynurenine formamidase
MILPDRPRIVDLTLPVTSGMPGIPTIAFYDKHPVKVQAVTVINEEQRALLQSRGVDVTPDAEVRGTMNTLLTISSHVGTHIDAPRHFYADGSPIDEVPLDRIVMREAIVLDVGQKAPRSAVTAEDLERTGVKPEPHQIAVIKTLWTDRKWGTPEFWPEMVYLDPIVGDWILDRKVSAVAMDCFPEKPFWRMAVSPEERGINHKKWLRAGILMIQLLTNLGSIGTRFTLIALPLRLRGMDGSPARVVGIESQP